MRRSITRPGRRWLQRALEAGLNFLFPPRCAGCGQLGSVWCPTCDQALVKVGHSGCPFCGFPRITAHHCAACELGKVQVRSFARYQPPFKQAILKLKYSPNPQLADLMAGWLLGEFVALGKCAELIVPVPLGDVRRRERGYNQVELIAKSMANTLNIPVQSQALVRVRETRSQVGLVPEERFENVHGAFSANIQYVQNKKILLLDDLLTSGATLIGCAGALIDSGASQVICLTVGRTIAGLD